MSRQSAAGPPPRPQRLLDNFYEDCQIDWDAKTQSIVCDYLDQLVEAQLNCAVLEVSRLLRKQPTDGAPQAQAGPVVGSGRFHRIFSFAKLDGRRMARLLAGSLLLWSLVHIVRYVLLSAKSVTIREAPPPLPFFPQTADGLIQDHFDGNGAHPELLMAESEFAIVMLYANWDSRSKEFRQSFVEVASAFHSLAALKFVAVNCHYHRGQCRRLYKVLAFPVIFAHTPLGQPVLFNHVLSSDRLFSWVFHLLNPLKAVQSPEDLHSLVSAFDFVVLGHFQFQLPKLSPRSFSVFLNSAFKFANSRSTLAFATVLNQPLAHQLGFSRHDQVNFYSAYEYPANLSLFSFYIEQQTKSQEFVDQISGIIDKYEAKVVYELELEDIESTGKSEALFHKLNSSSATIVLFDHSLGTLHKSVSRIALRKFSKLFYFCPDQENLSSISSPFEHLQNDPALDEFIVHARKICSLKQKDIPSCCDQLYLGGHCKGVAESDPFEGPNSEGLDCARTLSPLSHGLFKRRCCAAKRVVGRQKAELPAFDWRQRMDCQLLRLVRREHREIMREFEAEREDGTEEQLGPSDELEGLIRAGCSGLDQSIGFMAIDKRFGRHLMRKWGLPERRMGSDSLALVHRPQERIYWMHERISTESLANFVAGFVVNSTLDWEPRSQSIDPYDGLSRHTESVDGFPTSLLNPINFWGLSEMLDKTNRTHDSVVFFSGGNWHEPSRTVLHQLHQLQHYFGELDHLIRFYVFDTTRNSLPRDLKFNRLPTLVLFPAKSAGESHKFGTELAFTVPNLLNFILPRCGDELKWHLAFAACRGNCLERNARKAKEVLENIQQELKSLWRMTRIWRRKRKGNSEDAFGHIEILLKRRRKQRKVVCRMLDSISQLQKTAEGLTDSLQQQLAREERRAANKAVLTSWVQASIH